MVRRHVTLTVDHAHWGAVCHHETTQSRWKDPLNPLVSKHGALQLYLGASNILATVLQSLHSFRRNLKTYLFQRSLPDIIVTPEWTLQ